MNSLNGRSIHRGVAVAIVLSDSELDLVWGASVSVRCVEGAEGARGERGAAGAAGPPGERGARGKRGKRVTRASQGALALSRALLSCSSWPFSVRTCRLSSTLPIRFLHRSLSNILLCTFEIMSIKRARRMFVYLIVSCDHRNDCCSIFVDGSISPFVLEFA